MVDQATGETVPRGGRGEFTGDDTGTKTAEVIDADGWMQYPAGDGPAYVRDRRPGSRPVVRGGENCRGIEDHRILILSTAGPSSGCPPNTAKSSEAAHEKRTKTRCA